MKYRADMPLPSGGTRSIPSDPYPFQGFDDFRNASPVSERSGQSLADLIRGRLAQMKFSGSASNPPTGSSGSASGSSGGSSGSSGSSSSPPKPVGSAPGVDSGSGYYIVPGTERGQVQRRMFPDEDEGMDLAALLRSIYGYE